MLNPIKNTSDYSQVTSIVPAGKVELFVATSGGNLQLLALDEHGNFQNLAANNSVNVAATVSNAAVVQHADIVHNAVTQYNQTYSGGESRVVLTQSAFDQLASKDANTFYYIRED